MDFLSNGYTLLLPLAALATYLLIPQTQALAALIGAIDMPDGVRKINNHPVPRLGGLAFFLSFFLLSLPIAQNSYTLATLSGGALLSAFGVADDTRGLSPIAKLLGQSIAAATVLFIIPLPTALSFFGFSLPIGRITGWFLSFFIIIYTTNAANISDGLDGLCASLSAIALFSLAVFSLFRGGNISAPALLLAFSLFGFLPYNLSPARVFMGDCGSQLLGFAFASLALGAGGDGTLALEALLFLALPLLDTAASFLRRIAKGKSPFAADRGHFHHLCLDKGLSQPSSLFLLSAISIAVCAIALLLS